MAVADVGVPPWCIPCISVLAARAVGQPHPTILWLAWVLTAQAQFSAWHTLLAWDFSVEAAHAGTLRTLGSPV